MIKLSKGAKPIMTSHQSQSPTKYYFKNIDGRNNAAHYLLTCKVRFVFCATPKFTIESFEESLCSSTRFESTTIVNMIWFANINIWNRRIRSTRNSRTSHSNTMSRRSRYCSSYLKFLLL